MTRARTETSVVYAAGAMQGIGAFGVGPILDGGVKLSTIYGVSAVTAVAMGSLRSA